MTLTPINGLSWQDAYRLRNNQAQKLLEALQVARRYVQQSGERGSSLALNAVDAAIAAATGDAP